MNGDAWKSDIWSSAHGRIEIEPGKSVVYRRCSRCRCDFAEPPSGEQYAVYLVVQSAEASRSRQ